MPKVAGIGVPQKDWEWLPASCYYIEHPKGKILVDTAWNRRMSPEGVEDRDAQIRELGYFLYHINQGFTPKGATVNIITFFRTPPSHRYAKSAHPHPEAAM